MKEIVGSPAEAPDGLWRRAWLRVSALAAAAVIVSQLLDVPNKLLDIYSKVSAAFVGEDPQPTQPQAAKFSGAVVDGAGSPLAGVEILMTEYGQRIRSDTNGRYSVGLENPRSDLVSLRAELHGFEPRNLDAPLDDPSFQFVMKPLGSE